MTSSTGVSPSSGDLTHDDVVVSVQGLTKRFPVRRGLLETVRHPFTWTRATVVSDVTFTATSGEFLGLLGPNGAGKTTLLKMLATLIVPDSGSAFVNGLDVVSQAAAVRSVTSPCLATERSLYHRLTARQNLDVYADLQGVSRDDRDRRVTEVLEAVTLTDTGEKLVGQFSSGMLQRLLIARALLTSPRLLLLDEPTRSLDPISAREFRTFLRRELVKQRGCTVILATHNAEEAFELCDRVGVLNHGRLLASGVASHLAREFLGVRYRLATTGPGHPTFASLADRGIGVVTSVQQDGGADGWSDVTLKLAPDVDPSGVLAELSANGVRIASFEPVRPSLADLIEAVVQRGSGS